MLLLLQVPPTPAGLGFPFHPKAEPQFRHPLTRPSVVNHRQTKPANSHLSLQWPVCDAKSCSENQFWEDFAVPFRPGVLPSTVFEAVSFTRPGLSGTTCFHEQFNELFLQPSHASARHDTGLAHHLQAVGLLHSSRDGRPPFPRLLFPRYPHGSSPHLGNHSQGPSVIVANAALQPHSNTHTHCQAGPP